MISTSTSLPTPFQDSLPEHQRFIERAWDLRDDNPLESRQKAETIIKLSQTPETRLDYAKALVILSFLDFRQLICDTALSKAFEAQEILEAYAEELWLSRLFNTLALIHATLGNNDLHLDYLQRQLKMVQKLDHQDELFAVHHNLALYYLYRKNFRQSFEYFEKAQQYVHDFPPDKLFYFLTLQTITPVKNSLM
jgi:tetratricopeptide (TPR) repeat protein